jgi:two-component system nitrogen regulation response regulator GlnG/two-component system response regulator HydG
MTNTTTLDDEALPWVGVGARAAQPETRLVILWSLDEPDRVGESAVVTGKRVLGRGDTAAGDPAPRLRFGRTRPQGTVPGPALQNARVSRLQLVLEALPDGRLSLSSVGRSRLTVNGRECTEAVVGDGDTVHLRNAMLLLVTRRAPMPRLVAWTSRADVPFGAPDACGIVGESRATWALREALAVAARSNHHVLLHGPSGAGKELAARAVHALSERAARPLLARSAATFTETLLDAELFGNVKNFPNVGTPERPGLVGEADGGALFLDEIGELPTPLQAHLLRLLDRDGEYHRLGESRARRADVRFIAATNRPLDALKHDFAARLTARVSLSGLDARPEDVPLLASALLERFRQKSPALAERFFERRHGALAEPRLDPDLVEMLVRHPWRLHTRELERLLFIAVSTSPGDYVTLTSEVLAEVAPADETPVPDNLLRLPASAAPPPDKARIESALAAAEGRVAGAAERLGLSSRYVLYRLMRQYGIEAHTA